MMANRLRIAVVAVTHLNKGGGGGNQSALNRFAGSIAFVAAARAAFAVIEDPEDGERRFLLQAKNNLGKKCKGLAFRLEQRLVGDDVMSSNVMFEGDYVSESIDEALSASENRGAKKGQSGAARRTSCSSSGTSFRVARWTFWKVNSGGLWPRFPIRAGVAGSAMGAQKSYGRPLPNKGAYGRFGRPWRGWRSAMTGLRTCLRDRRAHWLFRFECDGQSNTGGIGRFEDGRIAEVFINGTEVGTAGETNAQDAPARKSENCAVELMPTPSGVLS
jgi:hypothetical protein